MLKEDILEYLLKKTNEYIKSENNEIYTAQYISNVFGVKRNTISHYISKMVESGEIIKINTRPVYFFHREAFEKKFFIISKNIFSSIKELFEEESKINREDDIFNNLIGAKDSLSGTIEKIKTSIFYPTKNGLPIMLSGPTGVGKSFIAELIHKYSIENGILKKDAPFITFNCAQYYNNPELLSSNLFGYVKGAFTGADKSQIGMIEAANGGILFLDEVHRLNNEGQEKLFTFMDQGLIRRMGQTEGFNKAEVRLIFATTELLSESFLETFLRRIPIVINIPGLNERENIEKIQFVYNFLISESMTFNKSILISQRAIEVLVSYNYKGNIGELKNTTKYICASAYSKNINSDTVVIKLNDLPEKLLKEASYVKESKIKKKNNILITPTTKFSELFINERSSSYDIEQAYKNIFYFYKNYSIYMNKEEFETKIFLEINSLIDKLIFKKVKSNENTMLQFIISSLQDVFKYIEYRHNFKFNNNSIYIVAYFLYAKGCKNLQWDKETNILKEKVHLYAIENNKEEVRLVSKLSKLIASKMDVNLFIEDEIFLSFYLKSLKLTENKNSIKSVILAHGYSTASSISSVVNRMLEKNIYEAFDMPIDISVKEIGRKLIEYIEVTNVSNGLIILVDMGSLKEIYHEIKDHINQPIAIINNVSTQMALFIGDLLKKDISLEELVNKIKSCNETHYKIIYPEKIKEKAIITSCITGIGTAKHIQRLLEKSIPKELEVSILVDEYKKLSEYGVNDELFQLYDVIAIISTMNPEIEGVNYISLDDLISGKGEEILYKIFKDVCDKNTVQLINNNLIRNFSLESVVSSITILDTNKILENIENGLNNLEVLIGKRIPNNKKVTLYIHISCLIERLIRKTPIENYSNLKEFIQCQEKMINNIKQAFSGMEEIYNVKINIEEIGYIYDIISAPIEGLEEF